MSIQEIALSQNQKKKLLKSIHNESIAFKDDNGDIVVNVETYLILKQETDSAPIEDIIDDVTLDFNSQYFLFS